MAIQAPTISNDIENFEALLDEHTRQRELLTDGIRSLLMEAHGYQTKVFEFISTEHTAKNLMIVGTKGRRNEQALEQVKAIKRDYGIAYHYLERLLSD